MKNRLHIRIQRFERHDHAKHVVFFFLYDIQFYKHVFEHYHVVVRSNGFRFFANQPSAFDRFYVDDGTVTLETQHVVNVKQIALMSTYTRRQMCQFVLPLHRLSAFVEQDTFDWSFLANLGVNVLVPSREGRIATEFTLDDLIGTFVSCELRDGKIVGTTFAKHVFATVFVVNVSFFQSDNLATLVALGTCKVTFGLEVPLLVFELSVPTTFQGTMHFQIRYLLCDSFVLEPFKQRRSTSRTDRVFFRIRKHFHATFTHVETATFQLYRIVQQHETDDTFEFFLRIV